MPHRPALDLDALDGDGSVVLGRYRECVGAGGELRGGSAERVSARHGARIVVLVVVLVRAVERVPRAIVRTPAVEHEHEGRARARCRTPTLSAAALAGVGSAQDSGLFRARVNRRIWD